MSGRAIEVTTVPTVQRVGGKRVAISDDAAGVMRALRELDDRFRCHYLVDEAVYVLELHTPQPDGSTQESLVGRYEELDHRIVKRAQEFTRPDYQLGDALEAEDRRRSAQREHERSQTWGEHSEHLAFALRKDLQRNEAVNTLNSRAFIRKPLPKE